MVAFAWHKKGGAYASPVDLVDFLHARDPFEPGDRHFAGLDLCPHSGAVAAVHAGNLVALMVAAPAEQSASAARYPRDAALAAPATFLLLLSVVGLADVLVPAPEPAPRSPLVLHCSAPTAFPLLDAVVGTAGLDELAWTLAAEQSLAVRHESSP